MSELIPDVEIFHKAVDWALRYNEFYNVKEVATAHALIQGRQSPRRPPCMMARPRGTTQTGPVARGYRSKIDGSVQPYGVVVPPTWKGAADKKKHRPTWIWNHGRSENLSELSFIAGRMKSAGEFTPEDTFVVHPYGRYCNATNSPGRWMFSRRSQRRSEAIRWTHDGWWNAGFSMGGAERHGILGLIRGVVGDKPRGRRLLRKRRSTRVCFPRGKTPPPWWEQGFLWRWYDATVCVGNFKNSPMLAYHGSEDKQGQSTTIMKRFAEKRRE
jgi:hypothetical protein